MERFLRSLNFRSNLERYFESLSESLEDRFSLRETENSFRAASAMEEECRQTPMEKESWAKSNASNFSA